MSRLTLGAMVSETRVPLKPVSMDTEIPDQTADDEVSLRGVVVQAVLVTVALFGLVFALGRYLEEPTCDFAFWVVEELGLTGIFLSILASDAFTFPVPPDTYLLVAVAARAPVLPILATCIAASLVAGSIAYAFGPQIVKVPIIRRRVDRFEDKGIALYQKYGVWTVTIAALSPIPFSIICWFAGIYRMSYAKFLLATTARITRFIGYYYLFVVG